MDPSATLTVVEPSAPPPPTGAATRYGRAAWRRRWVILWAVALATFIVVVGLPTSRPQIFGVVGLGLIASCAGTEARWRQVIVDFVPFFVLLTIYDALHGAAGHWFLPHAIPQIKIDEWLFGGTVPTVSLQHAFYTPGVAHIWDYAAFAVYMTHFILPYVVAGLLWKYDHPAFRRWAVLFIGLSFAAFFTYAIYPAVPPWMASQNAHLQPTAKIIDEMWAHVGFANGSSVFSATGHYANPVAAVPSLHTAYAFLFTLFLWRRAGKWRPLLALYPIAMAVTLVYTGEHYVIDIILGCLYATTVFVVGSKLLDLWERGRFRVRTPPMDRVPA
jgi:PAP2 superfamily